MTIDKKTENPLGGYLRFLNDFQPFARTYIEPAYQARKKFPEIGLDRPTDGIFDALLSGYMEIAEAVETIDLVAALIAAPPPRRKIIAQEAYLKFLIGAYLQEIYILEQRLRTYCQRVIRAYKPSLRSTIGVPTVREIEDSIHASFGGITSTRGRHVHQKRMSDAHIDRLELVALLGKFNSDYADEVRFEYGMVQFKWRKTIKENRIAINAFLDAYFDALYPYFAPNGKIIFPKVTRGKEPVGK